MLSIALDIALGGLALSCALVFARLIIGPTLPDRALALDTLYVNAIALLVVVGVRLENLVYFDAALLIALFGFVGTVAVAKFALDGDIVDKG